MSRELYEATARTVAMETYPGYPARRLMIEDADELDDLTLPDGEWSTGVTTFPTDEQQKELAAQGYELDRFGRPLHPWLRDMLKSPEVGVVTGLGEYWNWGPNRTADPIIITDEAQPKILLIRRSDTGKWALPGGYLDPGETGEQAAVREAAEETGVALYGTPLPVYEGVVADARTTAHAWAETSALLWRVDRTVTPHGNDDATDARWFPVDAMPGELHGSHAVLIERAIACLADAPLAGIVSYGEPLRKVVRANGGHMGYDRSIITTADGSYHFVKRHDDSAFTDDLKRSRSALYLQKEFQLYEHLRTYAPHSIPDDVRLLDGDSLVMQGLPNEEGWHWRAPKDRAERYVADVLKTVFSLQDVPVVGEPFEWTIKASCVTHLEEGWESVTDVTLGDIVRHVTAAVPVITREEFKSRARQLANDLPRLAARAKNLTVPEKQFFAHHDLRQANVAWHPEHGAKIVDWSWAGPGREHSDTTTLLIDLHKTGHDVSEYMRYFNRDHALTLIGFWLAHSLLPTIGDDKTVRFQQLLSSVSAYDLLAKNG